MGMPSSDVPEDAERHAQIDARRIEDPEASADLTRKIAAIVDEKQGTDLVALDVRELISYTDFLLIATARNERLAKAIHDEIRQRLKDEDDLLPGAVEGLQESHWVLMDYLDCIIHIQVPDTRDHYRLETLWGEAPHLELGLPAS
jgi:ribosome-associated protein